MHPESLRSSEGHLKASHTLRESRFEHLVRQFSWGEIIVGAGGVAFGFQGWPELLIILGAGKLALLSGPGKRLLSNMGRALTGRAPKTKTA